MTNLAALNELYHSSAGDELAVAELLPVLRAHSRESKPRVLEVGAGFGRNLLALAQLPGATVVACDISAADLKKAEERIQRQQLKNISTVLQSDGGRLPFGDNSFDIVVLWQVLEHVFSFREKAALLREVVRVVKPGGLVLIETPNFWFPFDYHDTGLPLIHWLLPRSARRRLIAWRRKTTDYIPSQYIGWFGVARLLRHGGAAKVTPLTKIYFQDSYRDIFRHWGGTRRGAKKIFFTLYFPVYCLLRIFGLPGDLLTPSLRLVFRIDK